MKLPLFLVYFTGPPTWSSSPHLQHSQPVGSCLLISFSLLSFPGSEQNDLGQGFIKIAFDPCLTRTFGLIDKKMAQSLHSAGSSVTPHHKNWILQAL